MDLDWKDAQLAEYQKSLATLQKDHDAALLDLETELQSSRNALLENESCISAQKLEIEELRTSMERLLLNQEIALRKRTMIGQVGF